MAPARSGRRCRAAHANAFAVALDQVGIVEIVAGIHLDAVGQAAAQLVLVALLQQRDLDALDLAVMRG